MREAESMRQVAIAAVAAAAVVVRERWGRPGSGAVSKSPGDYVTEVDRLAEEAARAVVEARTPGVPILAEEAGGASARVMWVIDPVDGTTNFMRSFPEVGVSVALVDSGRPVAGAVAAPRLGEVWSAADGGGAHGPRGEPLRVGGRAPGEAVVATGFPFRHKAAALARYRPVLMQALATFEDLRRPGAASLDLVHTAAGTWDGFFELGLSVWDIAAGTLLIREAGGVVTDWDGDPVAVLASGDILAGSPRCHEALLALVAAAGGSRGA